MIPTPNAPPACDGFAANDWTATIDASGITWTAPAATVPPAELDYATVVSFRFDSDVVAAAVNSALGLFEAGDPTTRALPSSPMKPRRLHRI